MSLYNPLNWQNENALSSYPFAEDLNPQDFIVDAKFVQFDNFTPILNSVQVDEDRVTLDITLDYGTANFTLYKEIFDLNQNSSQLRLYNTDKSRYMGVVCFGPGTRLLWEEYIGRKLNYSAAFLGCTVRSIPSKDAVYLLDGSYGDLLLSRTAQDTSIFYNVSTSLNAITFNAVTGHAVPEDSSRPTALKQINLVHPIKNNINLSSNEVVKISPVYGRGLSIDLVSGNVASTFSVPKLTS
jgi:hypothetical protein